MDSYNKNYCQVEPGLDEFYVEGVETQTPDLDPLIEIPMDNGEQLQPPVWDTVGLVSPGLWSMGSLIICVVLEDGEDMPPGTVCSWQDEDETYCLRKRSSPRVDREPEGDASAGQCGNPCTHNATWHLSPNVNCTVRSWTEGITTAATTIRWVNKHVPSVPTEEIVHDWIDPEWNRNFLISRTPPGQLFLYACPNLTIQQRLQVADQLAGHMKALSEMTSDYIETVQGTALEGAHSLKVREAIPLWKPRIEERVSREDYEACWKRHDDNWKIEMDRPRVGEPLVLRHNCYPMDFFVTTPSDPEVAPKVTGIINWNKVGYSPRWQIATFVRWGAMHAMDGYMGDANKKEDTHWRAMLSNACVRLGLPLELEYIKAVTRAKTRHYPDVPLEWRMDLTGLLTEETGETKDN